MYLRREAEVCKPDLSIVIVTHNAFHLVTACVTSILEHTHEITYEIIVVDNGSTDGSLERFRQAFPHIRLIANPSNDGYGAGCNLGMAEARGRYIAVLNDDIEVRDESFARLVRFLDLHRDVGVVAPKLLNPDGSLQPSVFRFPSVFANVVRQIVPGRLLQLSYVLALLNWLARRFRWNLGRLDKNIGSKEIECPMGAAFVVRRDVVEQVGGFDSDGFFLFCEEADWFIRIHRANWKIWYLADTGLVHHGSQTVSKLRHRYYIQQYKSFLHFYEKNFGSRTVFLYKASLTAVFMMKATFYWISAMMPWGNRLERLRHCETYRTIIKLFYDPVTRSRNIVHEMQFKYIEPPPA